MNNYRKNVRQGTLTTPICLGQEVVYISPVGNVRFVVNMRFVVKSPNEEAISPNVPYVNSVYS